MIYDCNTHSCLWYFNFIAIPSFVCPKLACIEWLINLNNDRHLFADSFVTVRPIAMKFGWDKENVSCLTFRKFCLNPTNFKRKLTMMFKLDLKKITLSEFRTPVQNGLMQRVNIFCTENEHLHAFYAPTKNRTNRMRASCWFLFLKKIGHYFWRRVYIDLLFLHESCLISAPVLERKTAKKNPYVFYHYSLKIPHRLIILDGGYLVRSSHIIHDYTTGQKIWMSIWFDQCQWNNTGE